MSKPTIAILGAGNMGGSLLSGLIANHYPPEHLWASDTSTEKLQHLKSKLSIHTTTDNNEAIQHADIVIFAVKPQLLLKVATAAAPQIQAKKPLVISIAAGILEKSIQAWLGGNIAIVRAMPNMPALIGYGATALFANAFASTHQQNTAESILRAVGLTVWLEDEKLMHIVTALSGSGPAYFFLFIEALQNAAIESGLPQKTARLLTLQTAYGAARMALESNVDAIELRKQVTSPGGTTEAALQSLEENDIYAIIKKALISAKMRSEELAETFGKSTER